MSLRATATRKVEKLHRQGVVAQDPARCVYAIWRSALQCCGKTALLARMTLQQSASGYSRMRIRSTFENHGTIQMATSLGQHLRRWPREDPQVSFQIAQL